MRSMVMAMAAAVAMAVAGFMGGCQNKPETVSPPAPEVHKTPPPAAPLATEETLPPAKPATTYNEPVITPAVPKSPPPAAGAHKYIVKKGDTLFKIARTELGNEHRIKDIKDANPKVTDWDHLTPGQEIALPAK